MTARLSGLAGKGGLLHPGSPGLRRSTLIEPAEGHVRAEVEDDFHNFQVELIHNGVTILDVRTGAPRYPWDSCVGAGPFLAARLVGSPLADAPGFDAQLSHCTHLYDLALLAAAHALDPQPTLLQAFVGDPGGDAMRAELYRNGVLELAWPLLDGVIQAPGRPEGESLRRLKVWLPDLPGEEHEAAKYLRRAVFISGGRRFHNPPGRDAASMPGQAGACYTFDPVHGKNSFYITASRRDFTAASAAPLAQLIG